MHGGGFATNPKDESAYVNRCYANWYVEIFDIALADCNQAIALDPKDATAYYNRGLVYNAKGNYSAAIADYTQAITLKPNYALAYNGGIVPVDVEISRAALLALSR